MPEEAKKLSFSLKLKFSKNGPLIEKKAPVFSACSNTFLVFSHPDVIKITFKEIRDMLNITTPSINFAYKVEVFERNNFEMFL